MNPYFNYFRDETLLTILIALKPLDQHLTEDIIDRIRIALTEDRDFYKFETEDFKDRPLFSLLL